MTFFNLFYDHKRDPRILDDLVPWERDIMIQMMIQKIEEENLKLQQAKQNRKIKKL